MAEAQFGSKAASANLLPFGVRYSVPVSRPGGLGRVATLAPTLDREVRSCLVFTWAVFIFTWEVFIYTWTVFIFTWTVFIFT